MSHREHLDLADAVHYLKRVDNLRRYNIFFSVVSPVKFLSGNEEKVTERRS